MKYWLPPVLLGIFALILISVSLIKVFNGFESTPKIVRILETYKDGSATITKVSVLKIPNFIAKCLGQEESKQIIFVKEEQNNIWFISPEGEVIQNYFEVNCYKNSWDVLQNKIQLNKLEKQQQ